MRFVADLPDYLGRGGPYLHDFTVREEAGRVRVELALTMVQAGLTVEEGVPVRPEVLADGLRAATFRYRALDGEGGVGEWQDAWETHEQLAAAGGGGAGERRRRGVAAAGGGIAAGLQRRRRIGRVRWHRVLTRPARPRRPARACAARRCCWCCG